MTFKKSRNIGLSIILMILAVVGMVPTILIHNITKHEAPFKYELEELSLISDLNELFGKASNGFNRFVFHSEGDFDSILKTLNSAILLSNDLEKKMKKNPANNQVFHLDTLKQISRDAKVLKVAVTHYKNESIVDPASDTSLLLEQIAFEANERTNRAFSVYIKTSVSSVNNEYKTINGLIQKGQVFSLTGMAVGILAGILVALFLSKSLNKPIKKLVEGTERMSSGDLEHRIQIDSSDEMGRLAAAVNSMSCKLKLQIETQKDLAKKALSAAESEKQKSSELIETNRKLTREVDYRKKMETELVELKDKAESASIAKSEFLANMSHELRTPLNHIIGFTEMVADGLIGDLNATQKEYLTDSLSSSRHLLSLINDILDLSKVEAGKMELDAGEVELRPLLENSLILVKEKALKNNIRLTSAINGIPNTVYVDERKLKQIIYNLLSNAVKFTPPKGEITLSAGTIHLSRPFFSLQDGRKILLASEAKDKEKYDKDAVSFSVTDTGIGLKQENLESIFDPFEQADKSVNRRFQGTGLGLSLTKQLIELHGGAIWAESEGKGKGCKVSFVVPIFDTA